MWRRQRILKVIEVPSIVMLDKTTERKSVREPRSGLSPSRGSRPSRSRTACDIGLPQFRCGTETILNFLVIHRTAPDKSVRRAAPVAAGEGPFRSDPRDFPNSLKEPSKVAPATRLEGVLGDCRASWSRAKKSTRDLLMVGHCIRVRIQVSIDSGVPK